MKPSRLVASVAAALLAMGVVGSGAVLSTPAVAQAPSQAGLCDSSGVDQFGDVGDSDYAAAYILCMRALGLSQGRSGGDYGPDRELNRGQMASFLIRLWTDHLGGQCPTDVVVPFTDTGGTTHEANIECLFGLGITQGTTATTYGPQDPLKASQISRFLYRTYQKAGGDQCQTTAGSELDRASECLFSLRVAPSTDEATAATPVIRSQMGVYVIGLWHNLTGKGLPPAPPQLATATTEPAVIPEPATVEGPGMWVVAADGTGLEQLSSYGGQLCWSPDGSRIAYTDYDAGGVWVVGADGTNAKQIASAGGYPVWSPDGSQIAYHGAGVWVVGADGSNAKQIGSVGGGPVWSPDGSRIAYTGSWDDEGLWIVGADGTGLKRIATYPSWWVSPVWSPDGSRLVYTNDDGLWVVGAGGTDLKHLSPHGRDPAWSPDGSRIAYYETVDHGTGVWVVGADGTDAKQIASAGGAPVWSPDGSRVALDDGDGMWVVGADGAGLKRVSRSGWGPVWSPDGSRIATGDYGYGVGMWVVGADGTGLKQIASAGGAPVWSPDGSRIAYTVRGYGGDAGLWVVDADGTNNRQTLVKAGPDDVGASWSRDGARISFTADYFNEEGVDREPTCLTNIR